MALLPLCLGLWLDLRGTPASEGLTALLDLYNNVRAQYDRAGLQPPAGSAVGGVLHLAQDLDEADAADGGLSLLVLDGDDLYSEGRRCGTAIAVSSPSDLKGARAQAREYIRRPEANLALLHGRSGKARIMRELFEFSHSEAQHCRSISGSETRLLCAVPSQEVLSAVVRAAATDDVGVKVVALLRKDPALWFDALAAASEIEA